MQKSRGEEVVQQVVWCGLSPPAIRYVVVAMLELDLEFTFLASGDPFGYLIENELYLLHGHHLGWREPRTGYVITPTGRYFAEIRGDRIVVNQTRRRLFRLRDYRWQQPRRQRHRNPLPPSHRPSRQAPVALASTEVDPRPMTGLNG